MTVADRWAKEDLSSIESKGLLRSLESLQSRQGARVRIDGRSFVNFTSNDYLGLCGDERLVIAAKAALDRYGAGGGASRLLAGGSAVHDALEKELAEWTGAESAVLFNTGYAANVGVLQTLAGSEDEIFSDALNHASIVDGCRLSRAKISIYPHVDMPALEALLERSSARRKIVVTDSLFSMDGEWAPLRSIVELCEAHGAALIVDEAHALGVFKDGLSSHLGLSSRVDVRVGTLGKSLGAAGAFAAGSRAVVELFINKARSLVFSTVFPSAVAAAALEALRLIRRDDSMRAASQANIEHFASGLNAIGYPAVARSPIFPVVLGEPETAVRASDFLRERGLLAKPIRPPTVPAGTSRLRFTVTAAHTKPELDQALDALRDWKRQEKTPHVR